MWRVGYSQNYEVNSCRCELGNSMLKLTPRRVQVLENQCSPSRFDRIHLYKHEFKRFRCDGLREFVMIKACKARGIERSLP